MHFFGFSVKFWFGMTSKSPRRTMVGSAQKIVTTAKWNLVWTHPYKRLSYTFVFEAEQIYSNFFIYFYFFFDNFPLRYTILTRSF